METPDSEPGKNKWWGRLAMVSAFLFALLWSLGSFFFWALLGLVVYFAFMALYSSGVKINFNRPQAENPYQSYQSRETSPPTSPLTNAKRVARNLAIIFAAMFLFFFIIGIFSGGDDNDEESSNVVVSDNENSASENQEANSFNEKGNTFYSQAQYDSALKYYNLALERNPDDQYASYNRALVYFTKQDYRRSIGLIRKCIKQHPDYNEAWWLLGDDYFSIKNYDSALSCLQTAYDNNFEDPNFLQLMAETYAKKDNRGKAIEFYKKVIERDSSRAEVYRELALLDTDHAEQYRKKASSLESQR